MFGTADPNTPELMGASNTPWIQPRLQQAQGSTGGASIDTLATSVHAPKVSEEDADAKLAFEALNGALVAHLLERESSSLQTASFFLRTALMISSLLYQSIRLYLKGQLRKIRNLTSLQN